MKKAFLIAPHQVDSEYLGKQVIFREVCGRNSIQVLTAEDRKTSKSLSAEDTIVLLNECHFAIADLSYERPSCYYELGYLQALKKQVYLICEYGTTLHQALGSSKIKMYSDLDSYKNTLEDILKDVELIPNTGA